jgi:hypothetical protein
VRFINKTKKQMLKDKKRKKHVLNKQKRKKRAAEARKRAKEVAGKIKRAGTIKLNDAVDSTTSTSKNNTKPKAKLDTIGSVTTRSKAQARTQTTKTGETKPTIESHTEQDISKTLRPSGTMATIVFVDDDDDSNINSDINSDISDISTDGAEEEIQNMRTKARFEKMQQRPSQPDDDKEIDEFERDPWNAVATVGLRLYVKEGEVEIGVIREEWTDFVQEEIEEKDEEEEKKEDSGKGKEI